MSLVNAMLTLYDQQRVSTTSIDSLETQEISGIFTAIRQATGVVNLSNFDSTLFADTNTGVVTANLPSAALLGGRIYIIMDESGNAATNNITIVPIGGQTINGAASYVINTNYGQAILQSNGSDWFVIG